MAYTNIDDPSAYFQTALYTGAGAGQTVTNDGNSNLQPDWLWIKRRNAGYAHALFDSNRGLGSSNPPYLESDSTAGENSNQNWISGVGTDSFTIGVNEQNLSNTSGTYVAWQWKANGGTTASNTDGDINSTVQVNSDAGFSIVTYTGNFTGSQGVGHGLGVRPDVVIIKNREQANSWVVWTSSLASGNFLSLDTTNAASSSSRIYQNGYTTSTFGIGANNSVNKSGIDYIAYCFASKQGYSKFGKYTGNGSGTSDGTFNGTFVYTGFKPSWVIIKRSDGGAEDWNIFDNKRPPRGGSTTDGNYINNKIYANQTSAESGNVYDAVDFLSNGFKIRTGRGGTNTSGGTYIYMAFAENPFVTSDDGGSIPTTAR